MNEQLLFDHPHDKYVGLVHSEDNENCNFQLGRLAA